MKGSEKSRQSLLDEENDFDKMEREFTELLEFWKKMYLRNGGEHGSN